MRLITIDNGNTNPHVGIFQNEKLTKVIPLKDYVQEKDDFIIASDVGAPLAFKPSFDLKTKRHTKKNSFFFEMPVNYSETLGDDRLILGYYAFKKIKENETFLVIDAGTFITMDVVNNNGFQGGYIFPGIKTFLASYAKGSRLPVVTQKEFAEKDLPHTTEEAILGAMNCYLASILENVIKKTSPSNILITGGGLDIIKAEILKLNLKVQLESDPHSIHLALAMVYQNHLH